MRTTGDAPRKAILTTALEANFPIISSPDPEHPSFLEDPDHWINKTSESGKRRGAMFISAKDGATYRGSIDRNQPCHIFMATGDDPTDPWVNLAGGSATSEMVEMLFEEIVKLKIGSQDRQADISALANNMFGLLFPRVLKIEQQLGITDGGDYEHPTAPRPNLVWEHETWNGDSQTVYFSTNDISFEDITKYDLSGAGLEDNPNIMNSGTGYHQFNWGFARTVIRVYRADIPGWSDNQSLDVKKVLFNNWWVTRVAWKG